MKKIFIYSFALATAMTAFTSCSDDDDAAPGASIPEKTYTAGADLAITIDGAPMVGKTISFAPKSDGTAEITLAGAPLSLDELMGDDTKADAPVPAGITLKTAGVLPGSASVTIPVTLEGEADNCKFSGTGETEYCTYSYAGTATTDNFTFELSDVKLKNQSLVGTWKFGNLLSDPDDESSQNPFNIIRLMWYGQDNEPAQTYGILFMFTMMPIISYGEEGEKASMVELLTKVLQEVTFDDAGNVIAKYADTGKAGMPVAECPKGIAQYVVDGDGSLRLFLNPAAIAAYNMTKSSRADEDDEEDSALLNALMPILMNNLETILPMAQNLLENGIPLHYGAAEMGGVSTDENSPEMEKGLTAFYLGTDFLKPLFNSLLLPIVQDQDFTNALVQEAMKDPEMGGMAAMMLPSIIAMLPSDIQNTTRLEIGINLKK